jgi:glycosyltransferase involved in cell wall biosynthesis
VGRAVAYVVSRFPKITETFVLNEMLALEALGARVELFPLMREGGVRHPEAQVFVERAHFPGAGSPSVARAHLSCLARAPLRYLRAFGQAVRHTLPSPRFLAGALAFWPRAVWIAETMRRLGVDHVHAHFATHPALVAWIAHELTGIPFSFTAHGSDLHVDQTGLALKLRDAELAITVSEYNREFVRRRLGARAAEKLAVLHCGVDTERLVRDGEPPAQPFEILCVAALRGVKGHRHLIDSCRLLRDRGLAFRCHLVGGGPREEALRRQVARLGLGDAIAFHGPQPHAVVLERMRAAHVQVLCSVQDRAGRREGIPVALMEAMSCGLPVVASAISGIPELVEDGRTGLLTPPGDARAIADALERLARSADLRSELGRAGREAVVRRFDLRVQARALAELLGTLPARTRAASAQRPEEPWPAPRVAS